MIKQRRSSGFTLTEMLVVIAIIAILAAILFAVFRGAKEKGRQGKCIGGLVQIQQKVHEFKQLKARYPQYLVAQFTTFPPTVRTINGKQVYEVAALSDLYPDFLSSADPFLCPNDQERANMQSPPYVENPVAEVVVLGDPTNRIYKTLIYSSYAGPVPGSNAYWNYYGYQVGNVDGVQVDPTNAAQVNAYITAMNQVGLTNRNKWPRLANRQAPDYTVITHCRHHRIQTSGTGSATDTVANDLVVRLDGKSSTNLKFMSYNWTTQPEQ